MSFTTSHNKYLDPPDDPPVCEDGCGEALTKDIAGNWYCSNRFCPLKFDGVAREMAEMLIGANETVKYLSRQITNIRNGRDLVYGKRRD